MRLHIPGIEINAVMQCNLACAGCSHASPVAEDWSADPSVVLRDLHSLRAVADVDEVRVVGGEPLLHPALTEVLRAIRDSQIGGVVRVITNATRLHQVGLEWVDLVDEVYVSVYPGAVVSADAVRALRARAEEIGTRVAVNRFTHFRPVLPMRPLTQNEVMAVFQTCQVAHAWSCHTVQDGYVYLCPMTVPLPSQELLQDGRCAIEPLQTLADRLAAFLASTTPLAQCRSCLGTVGRASPHRQANRKTWLSLSRAAIDWDHVERVRANPFADNGCVDNSVPPSLR